MHSVLGAASKPHVVPVYGHGMGGKSVAGHPQRDVKRLAARVSKEVEQGTLVSTKRRRNIKAAAALLAFNAPASPPHDGAHGSRLGHQAGHQACR